MHATASGTETIIRDELVKFNVNIGTILCATTDTTNTMPTTVRKLGLEWQKCAAHVIQLAIGHALDVQPLLKKVTSHVKKIAAWFYMPTNAQR